MIGVEYILLINTGVFAIILFSLIILSKHKKGNGKKQRKVMSSEMRKIKDEVSESD